MDTDALIAELAREAGPVRRLRPAWIRRALWLALALPPVVIVVTMDRTEGALSRVLGDRRTQIELAAILATALSAAICALNSTVPGSSRKWFLLPLLPLAVWLASLCEPRDRIGSATASRACCCASMALLPADGADGRHPDRGDPGHAPPRGSVHAASDVLLCSARRRGARQLRAAAGLMLRGRVDDGPRLEFRRSSASSGWSRCAAARRSCGWPQAATATGRRRVRAARQRRRVSPASARRGRRWGSPALSRAGSLALRLFCRD